MLGNELVSTESEDCPCCGFDGPYDNTSVVVCGSCGYDERTDGMYDCVDCELSGLESGPAEWHKRIQGHEVRGKPADESHDRA